MSKEVSLDEEYAFDFSLNLNFTQNFTYLDYFDKSTKHPPIPVFSKGKNSIKKPNALSSK